MSGNQEVTGLKLGEIYKLSGLDFSFCKKKKKNF